MTIDPVTSIRPIKSGARCRLFAYGPADAIVIPKPHQGSYTQKHCDYMTDNDASPRCPGKEAVKRV